MYHRWIEARLKSLMGKPYVHIVFGARQTGKSTLIKGLLPADAFVIDLSLPLELSRFRADPQELVRICRSFEPKASPQYVFIDEIQTVPDLFGAVQSLYDSDKERFRFVISGSSARRLRATGANLLPGRCFLHRLQPLVSGEYDTDALPGAFSRFPVDLALPAHGAEDVARRPLFPKRTLEARLAFGDLPGIAAEREEGSRDLALKSYSTILLEEEIRREAAIRDWPAFVQFLRLAAAESGSIVSFQGLSKEVGLSAPTIRSHYQLLEDMFIGFTIPAYSGSQRKELVSSPKFLFFDLGVRNAATGSRLDESIVRLDPGRLFEHWVGVELHKRLIYLGDGNLSYFRTRGGAEVDFIVERGGELIPVEAKWTENPTMKDARHLISFMEEAGGRAKKGYIICRCPFPQALDDRIVALPWQLF